MRNAKLLVVAVIVSSCLIWFSSSAHAIDAIQTPDEYWPASVPLQLSAYSFSSNGDLLYLELYNDSDTVLDPLSWTIRADFTVKSTAAPTIAADNYTVTRPFTLKLADNHTGKMLPGGHAVVAASATVAGASYYGSGWGELLQSGAVTVSAAVIITKDGYKTDSYTLKTINDGELYRRTKTTTSYSSGSTAFSVTDPAVVYDDGLYTAPMDGPPIELTEIYAYSSDCAPEEKDASPLCGDYLKFRIMGAFDTIEDYVVRTDNSSTSRTSSNTFSLENAEEHGAFLTLRVTDVGSLLSLTNSGGYIWFEDKYEGARYGTSVPYPSFAGTHQGWSYAQDANSNWQWTSNPQPEAENRIEVPTAEVTVCPTGKYLNPDTSRCRTIEEAVNALSACPEGQYRNPSTNRCRQIVSTASTLVPCGEGQERNPSTNRCRSIASAVAELLPCDEGYERNPATNRCRKVAGVSTTASGLGQLVEPEKESGVNIWTWSIIAVVAAGAVGYGVYEWRHELFGAGQAIAAKFSKK